MKYLVVIEETTTGFSAYSPDLPGCAATGASREEAKINSMKWERKNTKILKEFL